MITTDDNICQDIKEDIVDYIVNDVSENAIDINVIKGLNVENDSEITNGSDVENDCKVTYDSDVLIDETLNGLDQEDPRVIEAVLQRLIRSPDKTTPYNFTE